MFGGGAGGGGLGFGSCDGEVGVVRWRLRHLFRCSFWCFIRLAVEGVRDLFLVRLRFRVGVVVLGRGVGWLARSLEVMGVDGRKCEV